MSESPTQTLSEQASSSHSSNACVITHKEDADGICSGALVRVAGIGVSKVILADYPNFISQLEKAVGSAKYNALIICDLGLSKKNEKRFVELLEGATSAGKEVTYIDHHDIGKEVVAGLKKAGVNLIHTVHECTSVQVYRHYKKD